MPINYQCLYCRTTSTVEPGQTRSCPACGAPLDVHRLVTDSGWVQLPPTVDMAHIQFGRSHVQIEGTTVPVADFRLDQGDRIYFSHHRLVWADTDVRLETRKDRSGVFKRTLAGMPLFMVAATGPGHVALSDNHAGEIVSIPLSAGHGLWVREHVFLGATDNIGYQPQATGLFLEFRDSDNDREYEYPIGRYDDIFFAQDAPGLLLIHSPGNTMLRDLAPGEHILIRPRALLYRDLTVTPSLVVEYPRSGGKFWHADPRHCWLDLCGPGRVAISSKYEYEPMSTNSLTRGYAGQLRW
jgi:uncharacterized protein (AIM24 family)